MLLLVLVFMAQISNAQSVFKFTDFHDMDSTIKRSQGTYFYGLEEGLWKYWYKDGKIREEANYIEGKLNGSVKIWFNNGQAQNEGFFRFNIQDSAYISWFTDGKIKSIGQFDYGFKDSIWNYYFPNGKLYKQELWDKRNVKVVEARALDGTITLTEGNGLVNKYVGEEIISVSNYSKGALNGEYISYFQTGSKKEKGSYVSGLKDGE